ncbi:MAG: hypothetical protein GY915_00670 [bacterium]|nr:hypothetical protein [bacterium]
MKKLKKCVLGGVLATIFVTPSFSGMIIDIESVRESVKFAVEKNQRFLEEITLNLGTPNYTRHHRHPKFKMVSKIEKKLQEYYEFERMVSKMNLLLSTFSSKKENDLNQKYPNLRGQRGQEVPRPDDTPFFVKAPEVNPTFKRSSYTNSCEESSHPTLSAQRHSFRLNDFTEEETGF